MHMLVLLKMPIRSYSYNRSHTKNRPMRSLGDPKPHTSRKDPSGGEAAIGYHRSSGGARQEMLEGRKAITSISEGAKDYTSSN